MGGVPALDATHCRETVVVVGLPTTARPVGAVGRTARVVMLTSTEGVEPAEFCATTWNW
jgi:hypothetical protein